MAASRFFRCPESGLGIQVFSHDRPISYPEHVHSEIAIVICTAGKVESTQFGCRELLNAEQVLFTNSGVGHASRYCVDGEPTRGVTLEFHPSTLPRLGYSGSSVYMLSRFLGKMNLPEVAKLARMIEDEAKRPELDSHLLMAALARQIVVLVLREWPRTLIRGHDTTEVAPLPRNELVRAIEMMHEIPARDFAVPALAQRMHRSPSTFSRLFLRSLGDSPHRYYQTILLQQAADLLAETDRSVKDIALTLGFNSVSHFSNSFRARWNLTPTAYRQERTIRLYQADAIAVPEHL
jgi:AraC-like DNA-binding protein